MTVDRNTENFSGPALEQLLGGMDIDYFAELSGLELQARRQDCFLLVHAHCLPSFLVLVRFLVQTGFCAANIFLVPKPYSAIREVSGAMAAMGVRVFEPSYAFPPGGYDDAQAPVLNDACRVLLERARKNSSRLRKARVIVVDDGGLITSSWFRVAGLDNSISSISIQHTSSGIGRRRGPTGAQITQIDVARSAAKKRFEARVIARSVIRKIDSLGISLADRRVGVAGVGAIGRALIEYLNSRSIRPIAFDLPSVPIQSDAFAMIHSRSEFIKMSDVVFGCTGANWASAVTNASFLSGKTFVSCSSRDVEFKHFLRTFSQPNGSRDVFGAVPLATSPPTSVENGGFPINFDRVKEWETFAEIALTRYLILGAILYAQCLPERLVVTEEVMLPVWFQRKAVEDWLESTGFDSEDFGVTAADVRDDGWWRRNSSGAKLY